MSTVLPEAERRAAARARLAERRERAAARRAGEPVGLPAGGARRRLVAALVLVLGVGGGAGAAALLAGGGDAGWTAEFTSARGLVSGNDVRVDGAIAGRVRAVELTRDGRARVRFTLRDGAPAPRADAAAAIRPVDLLGDTFLALSPGRAARGLRGPIPVARTSTAPRFDELLRTFQPAVRDGVKALLVEGGLALDRRGADLARATVALRPAVQAADGVVRELDAQDGALARLVPRAERAVGQVAARSGELGPLLDGLAGTLGTTAARERELDAGLAALPATLGRLRSTAGELEGTARSATPVAAQLRDAAPGLAAAVEGLGPLLGRVRAAAGPLTALLRTGRGFLTGGSAGFGALTQGLRDATAAAPDTDRLLDALVPAAPKIAEGFLVNFPDQAAEPGRQPFDPFADPRRAYWRGAAVFSCEAFGVPVRPGCLQEVLGAKPAPRRTKREAAGGPATAGAPATSTPAGAPGAPARAPRGTDAVPNVLDPLTAPGAPAEAATPVTDVLDFLLGP